MADGNDVENRMVQELVLAIVQMGRDNSQALATLADALKGRPVKLFGEEDQPEGGLRPLTSKLTAAQLPAATVYNNQVNTFTSQPVLSGVGIKLTGTYVPTIDGEIGYNGTNLLFREGGTNKTISSSSGAASTGSVSNLFVRAANFATTANIKADFATLKHATAGAAAEVSAVDVTLNIATAGPAANGRDQSGAFSIGSWAYGYIIWNGTTKASLASASATAPTMPSGYTHYLLVCALRLEDIPENGTPNILGFTQVGKEVAYACNPANAVVLTTGQATSATSVACASRIPPISRIGRFLAYVSHNTGCEIQDSGAAGDTTYFLNSHTAGEEHRDYFTTPVSSTQTLAYRWNTTGPSGGNGLSLYTAGFLLG